MTPDETYTKTEIDSMSVAVDQRFLAGPALEVVKPEDFIRWVTGLSQREAALVATAAYLMSEMF